MSEWSTGAELLQRHLDARGWTAVDLANGFPFGDEAVRRWLRGQNRPSKRFAKMVDDRLGANGAIQAAFGYASATLTVDEGSALKIRYLEATVAEQRAQIEALNEGFRALRLFVESRLS